MSIRGIDAQIMIQRSQMLGREVAQQNRSAVNFQNYLSGTEKQRANVDANRTVQVSKTENNKINADAEREKGGESGGKSNKKREAAPPDPESAVEIGSPYDDDFTIDIRI